MTAGIADFPATLPAKTVVGRLASTAGPAEAVPIAALSSDLADASTITFLQSGAGAVARSVQSKLRDIASVQDFGAVVAYDNFDRPDRLLNGDIAPSGHTWTLSGTGAAAATITDGQFVAASNCYASLDYGQAILKIGGAFSIAPGTGTDRTGTVVALIADSVQFSFQNALHLIVSPNAWALQKIVGGVFTSILSGVHYLRTDGSLYQISFSVSGNTATVLAPNGTTSSVTDADIGAMATRRYGVWQRAETASSYSGRWQSIAMGRRPLRNQAGLGAAAPMSDIAFLQGVGLTMKTGLRGAVLSGGAGWYTVATATTYSGFVMAGIAKLSAIDTGTLSVVAALKVSARSVDVNPILTQDYVLTIIGSPIDQIRISTNANVAVQLDIHVPGANAVTLNADFDGQFTPVEAPAVGAVALGTGSKIVTLFDSGAVVTYPPTTVTGATYTVIPPDTSIIANRAGTVTLTLESAAAVPGKQLIVRTIQAQTVVSATGNVVPLVGGAAGTAILAAIAGKWALLHSDGTNWQIMAGN